MITLATKKKLALFYRYLKRLGVWRGIMLYLRLHILQQVQPADIFFLPYRISFRRGTTDLATFDQVFISKIYDLPLKVSPKVIVDCGANIGAASIFFANRYPSATIIAVEPERSNFELLKNNCAPYPNISVLQRAVTSFPGQVHVVDSGSGKYAYRVMKTGDQANDRIIETIETITLDALIDQFQLPGIDLLKIDIEGSEKDLFGDNYERWLSRTRTIAVEMHDRFVPGATQTLIMILIFRVCMRDIFFKG